MIGRVFVATILALSLTACSDTPVRPTETPEIPHAPTFALAAPDPAESAELVAFMDAVNASLDSKGANYRISVAEYISATGAGDQVGSTLLQKDVGNKRLPEDFVPFDPRRSDWSGASAGGNDDITFVVDQTIDAIPPSAIVVPITAAQTTSAIRSAMSTWDGITCSNLQISENSSGGVDIGIVAALNGLGGSLNVKADVQHAGWRDINFGSSILAATFTFVFTDGTTPTDIDRNGRLDVAFREIYYDPSFIWRVDGVGNIDVESVALHESGHGLSQTHFGNIFLRNDGTLDVSPLAVMNAVYQAPRRALLGADIGGNCTNWGNWPRR